MATNDAVSGETGLQFFGKLSAAVSHDLKNVLAVINEKAGLLEDFCQMARRGMTIDIDRIDAVTAQVQEQVARADDIIRSFNRFAHSADEPVAQIDLEASLKALIQLAQRPLASLGVTVAVQPSDAPVMITTNPLVAQGLIWAGIQWAAHGGDQKDLTIAAERDDQFVRVLIGPIGKLPDAGDDEALRNATEAFRKILKAEISTDAAARRLQIQFAALKAS
jgi:light-regulated signal transduction histidine kinase (bacteriophytochrome)